MPHRVLVYRNGNAEADCHISEVDSIRKAFEDMYPKKDEAFIPPITYIVGVSQHNVRIVPAGRTGRDKNVPSGTCLDNPFSNLTPLQDARQQPDIAMVKPTGTHGSDSFGFMLVPHKGILGTSKSVLYKTVRASDDVVPSNKLLTCLARAASE